MRVRRRPTLISSWRMRISAGTFMAWTVGAVTVPVELMPWRAWKRRTAAST